MTLALIAGQGVLPHRLIAACATPPIVCALEGFAPDLPEVLSFRIETLGSFLAALQARGVREVCFAGSLQRPALDPARIDAQTMPLVPRMMQALQQGDDAALRIVLSFFEDAGFTIVSATDILPDLLPPEGVLSKAAPDQAAKADVARGFALLKALSPADLGQGCVIARGQPLAVEAQPGTAFMLESLATLERPVGGVFVKAPKDGQDRRIDLPTIGPDTIAQVQRAGLAGLAIQAGGVQIIDRDQTVAAADDAGLFLWVHP